MVLTATWADSSMEVLASQRPMSGETRTIIRSGLDSIRVFGTSCAEAARRGVDPYGQSAHSPLCPSVPSDITGEPRSLTLFGSGRSLFS